MLPRGVLGTIKSHHHMGRHKWGHDAFRLSMHFILSHSLLLGSQSSPLDSQSSLLSPLTTSSQTASMTDIHLHPRQAITIRNVTATMTATTHSDSTCAYSAGEAVAALVRVRLKARGKGRRSRDDDCGRDSGVKGRHTPTTPTTRARGRALQTFPLSGTALVLPPPSNI